MIKIGIDARSILNKEKAGVEIYTFNLINHLAKIDYKNDLEFWLYLQQSINEGALKDFILTNNKRLKPRVIKLPRRGWLKIGLPFSLFCDAVKLVHLPSSLLPPLLPVCSVITIHSFACYYFPELYHPGELRHFYKLLPSSIRRANAIIAISETTKSDIIRLFPEAAKKVKVIYNGVDTELFKPQKEDNQIIKSRYGLPDDNFVLYVGTITPSKNLSGILRAFKILTCKQTFRNYKLILAGKQGYNSKLIFSEIEALGLSGGAVRYIGYVDHRALPSLYSAAKLFVYPSFYEGFGLSALEAMACGIPVITANTSCFPEIFADAALQVDPKDYYQIFVAMEKVLTDELLRASLIERGLTLAKRYSWAATAERTLEVYLECLK